MKRFLLGALSLMVAICCSAELKQALVLHMYEGDEVVYLLDTEPTVTFDGQQMVVSTAKSDSPETIPMDEVDNWSVDMVEFSTVREIPGNEESVKIAVLPGTVNVYNPASSTVAVYSLDGKLVATDTGAEVQFSLPAGIYIIKASNKTYKIAVR